MEFGIEDLSGKCECGRTHTLATKIILLEAGATKKLAQTAETLGLGSGGCIICDSNTKQYADFAADNIKPLLAKKNAVVMLKAKDLHANEEAFELAGSVMPEDSAWILAAGSGTVHDIARYVAHKRKIPFISYPTAASVDGFVSTVCAATLNNYKKTIPGVAPLAVVADTDVFSKAPYRLTASGIGDMLGKYISLADWKSAPLLVKEDFCERIYSMTKKAVEDVRANLPAIHAGDTDAYETLMSSLLLSGLAMQMWGDSRPASGSEHHLSHFWEMGIVNSTPDALHGEKVGVGLLCALRFYEKITQLGNIEAKLAPYGGMPLPVMRKKLGVFYEDILKENQPDILRGITIDKVAESFPALKGIIAGLPNARKLRPFMQAAGCATTMEEIGLSRDIIPDSILLAPFIRRRLTIMRASKLLPMD